MDEQQYWQTVGAAEQWEIENGNDSQSRCIGTNSRRQSNESRGVRQDHQIGNSRWQQFLLAYDPLA